MRNIFLIRVENTRGIKHYWMIAKRQLAFAILSLLLRMAIFHASPPVSKLPSLFGGNANQIRALRELLRSNRSLPKEKRTSMTSVFLLVETIGIEPMTSCMSSMHSNQLSYASVTLYIISHIERKINTFLQNNLFFDVIILKLKLTRCCFCVIITMR